MFNNLKLTVPTAFQRFVAQEGCQSALFHVQSAVVIAAVAVVVPVVITEFFASQIAHVGL
jgi:hypothetical protein